MALVITNAVAQAMASAFDAAVDAGTGAIIEIYSGSPPGPEAAATGTKLATLAMSADAFAAVADANPGALLTANAIVSDSSADATGTAGYFRILTQAGGTAICEGTCGTSGADMIFNSVAITAGSTVAITSLTITMPES